MGNEATYTLTATPEELLTFIENLKSRGAFEDLHSVEIRGTVVTATLDTPEMYYQTRYYIYPQATGFSRLEIENRETDSPRPFLIWDRLRRELSRSGYQVESVSGEGSTIGSFGHPFVDPEQIPNPNHRLVITATIQEFLDAKREGRRMKSGKDLAEELGYSPARYSEIKNLYLKETETE